MIRSLARLAYVQVLLHRFSWEVGLNALLIESLLGCVQIGDKLEQLLLREVSNGRVVVVDVFIRRQRVSVVGFVLWGRRRLRLQLRLFFEELHLGRGRRGRSDGRGKSLLDACLAATFDHVHLERFSWPILHVNSFFRPLLPSRGGC